MRNWKTSTTVCLQILALCIAVGCVVAVWLIASSRQGLSIEDSLITGNPCRPPCWHDIVPGVTTQAELSDFLEGNEALIGPCESFDYRAAGGANGVRCNHALFHLTSNIVETITLYFTNLLKLSDVIAIYGAPQYVRSTFDRNQISRGDDFGDSRVLISYAASGFTLETRQADSESYRIDEDTLLAAAVYFSPNLATIATDAVVNLDMSEWIPWTGFGIYPCTGQNCP